MKLFTAALLSFALSGCSALALYDNVVQLPQTVDAVKYFVTPHKTEASDETVR